MGTRRPLEILLVEDNPGDVRLIVEAFGTWRIPPRIRVAGDGWEALQILDRAAETGAQRPDLILLDLNLPGLSGRELLRSIKESGTLRGIPVIVLSSSDAKEDVAGAYALHANCYLVKPVYLDEYFEVVRALEEFWCSRVRLSPTVRRGPHGLAER